MQNTSARLISAFTLIATCTFGQKAWVAPANFGLAPSEAAINPSITLSDLSPANLAVNMGAWDWVTDDKVVVVNWIWNPPAAPSGDIWMMEGLKTQDKTKITLKKYYNGTLREPLGVKVVNGDVYVAIKYALVKMVDANKDGMAESVEQIVEIPHKEDSYSYNHYQEDLKYKDGFFYIALGAETRGAGYPGYPVMETRGSVVKIDLAKKTQDFLVRGLRTPDGLGWGPDGELFVTDNQGAWLPSSKLIHVVKGRFYGLQPIETGDPSLVESPPAVWMPHGEASSSPTQPMMLEKGPFAGQFLVGDNIHGVVNRIALEKVNGEYQGVLFHFTGGVYCAVHRLLQNDAGDVYFGGLGSPINTWNYKDRYYGMQLAKFNGKSNFEVKEILSKADGFTLHFNAPVGPSAEDAANYRLRQWRYVPTKEYGGPKIDNVALTLGAITVDPTRTYVNIKVNGLLKGRVVDFQFHKDLMSQASQPIWTSEAWYTLNQISTDASQFPVGINASDAEGAANRIKVSKFSNRYVLDVSGGYFTEVSIMHLDGRMAWQGQVEKYGSIVLSQNDIRPGIYILALKGRQGLISSRRIVFN